MKTYFSDAALIAKCVPGLDDESRSSLLEAVKARHAYWKTVRDGIIRTNGVQQIRRNAREWCAEYREAERKLKTKGDKS